MEVGFDPLYVELWSDGDATKKAVSKTRYSCESCGLHAWAKPGMALVCRDCEEPMQGEDDG
jgi:hypothetical protein